METINLNVRIDKNVEEQADKIFNELGFDMETAINLFLNATIRERGIPFDLKLDIPNDLTALAIEEGRRMISDHSTPRYSNMADLKAALEKQIR